MKTSTYFGVHIPLFIRDLEPSDRVYNLRKNSMTCFTPLTARLTPKSALTTENQVDYQNGLTPKNAPFALAADSLLTNYRWTIKKLKEADLTGERYGLHSTKSFFGIDVWAQDSDMPGPPRVSVPPFESCQ